MHDPAAHQFRFSLAAIPAPLVYAEHRTIRSCNQRFADLFGYDIEQLVGQGFHRLYPEFEDFVRTGRQWHSNFGGDPIYQDERIMRKADGTRFWAQVRGKAEEKSDPFVRAVYIFEPLSRPVTRSKSELTDRQTQIVSLVAMGKTNRQIASELGLSTRTIEAHRARIMKAVNVKNSAQLITWFQSGMASDAEK